jgi:hypothetical protein
MRTDGRHVYFNYLLTHPGWTLSRPFDDRQRFFGTAVTGYGTEFHLEPRGAFGVIGSFAAPRSIPLMEFWSLAVAVALASCCFDRRRRIPAAVLGVTLLLAVLAFYASWHGDAEEIDRHALTAAIQLRLVLWIGTVLAIDVLAEKFRRSRDGATDMSLKAAALVSEVPGTDNNNRSDRPRTRAP